MGRDCGDLALWAGLSVGAETILVPEEHTDIKDVAEKLKVVLNVEKHSIVMVAEGCMSGHECAEQLTKYINVDARVSVLGHIQRGGSPSGVDRVLASRLGGYAVELLMQGQTGFGVGIQNNQLTATPFDEIFNNESHKFNTRIYDLAKELSI